MGSPKLFAFGWGLSWFDYLVSSDNSRFGNSSRFSSHILFVISFMTLLFAKAHEYESVSNFCKNRWHKWGYNILLKNAKCLKDVAGLPCAAGSQNK